MVAAGRLHEPLHGGLSDLRDAGVSGQVRHAQQGYSGFVATISINADRLNKLYEYDYDFVSSAVQLLNADLRRRT